MTDVLSGGLRKMKASLSDNEQKAVEYSLVLDDQLTPLNPLLGKPVELTYTGKISCIHCGRKSNKSFNQGYCYPCFKSLAQCDTCIIKPEKCHFHLGTCREPEWAEQFCMQDHYVYLSNTSGIKVGITRGNQVPTRWIDQGATQALPLYRVKTRYIAGLLEIALTEWFKDKTNWRAMLKGAAEEQDLKAVATDVYNKMDGACDDIRLSQGLDAISKCDQAEQISIQYPVLKYPDKIKSENFDKDPVVTGTLLGIKGQYLILEDAVLNLRKFGGYQIECRF